MNIYKYNKINSIEIIRAFMCIFVFVGHFCGAFIPLSSLRQMLLNTPFHIIFNGNIPVRIMFTITGIVIGYKYFTKKCYEKAIYDIVKRYFRFLLPIVVACSFAYFLMKMSLMKNVEVANITQSKDFLGVFNTFEPKISLLIRESLYGVIFLGNNGYVGPMWTMKYEFYGSILVLVSLVILKDSVKLRVLYYLFFLLFFKNNYYTYFILGMSISDYITSYSRNINSKINIIFLIISFIYICNPNNIEASYFNFVTFSFTLFVFFINLLQTNIEEYIDSENNLFVRIGRNSFAIYLIHWSIIESLSCELFLYMYNKVPLNVNILITFFVSFVIVILISEIFYNIVDKLGIDLANKVSMDIEKLI